MQGLRLDESLLSLVGSPNKGALMQGLRLFLHGFLHEPSCPNKGALMQGLRHFPVLWQQAAAPEQGSPDAGIETVVDVRGRYAVPEQGSPDAGIETIFPHPPFPQGSPNKGALMQGLRRVEGFISLPLGPNKGALMQGLRLSPLAVEHTICPNKGALMQGLRLVDDPVPLSADARTREP